MNSRREFNSNPFSTRFVRPGAIPFVFSDGQTARELIQRLRTQNWRGQIIGPHGSGKSTLIHTIIQAIDPTERTVNRFTLSNGQRTLPVDWHELQNWTAKTLVVVDGFEQLSFWQRRKIINLCQQNGAGLLITAHCSVGMPTIYETSVDLLKARQVIASLLADDQFSVCDNEIQRLITGHDENLREVLFELYDLYQTERKQTVTR